MLGPVGPLIYGFTYTKITLGNTRKYGNNFKNTIFINLEMSKIGNFGNVGKGGRRQNGEIPWKMSWGSWIGDQCLPKHMKWKFEHCVRI